LTTLAKYIFFNKNGVYIIRVPHKKAAVNGKDFSSEEKGDRLFIVTCSCSLYLHGDL
jgi:hypothetical protein